MPSVSISVGSGGIVCNPDSVLAGTSPNVTITFTLQTAGYRFASTNAIVVPSPSNQFPNPAITVSNNQVTLLDVNSDQNSYKYNVNLVKTSDNSTLSVDPTIENGK